MGFNKKVGWFWGFWLFWACYVFLGVWFFVLRKGRLSNSLVGGGVRIRLVHLRILLMIIWKILVCRKN